MTTRPLQPGDGSRLPGASTAGSDGPARTAPTRASARTPTRGRARTGRVRAAAQEPETLLAFGAPWCTPWQMLRPHLDSLSHDGVTVDMIDVDEDPAAAERHRIISLPTILVMRGTEERRRIVGATNGQELLAVLHRRR